MVENIKKFVCVRAKVVKIGNYFSGKISLDELKLLDGFDEDSLNQRVFVEFGFDDYIIYSENGFPNWDLQNSKLDFRGRLTKQLNGTSAYFRIDKYWSDEVKLEKGEILVCAIYLEKNLNDLDLLNEDLTSYILGSSYGGNYSYLDEEEVFNRKKNAVTTVEEATANLTIKKNLEGGVSYE